MQATKLSPPFGPAALDNPDVPIARLALVPCRNADGTPVDTATAAADFAVIYYLSHTAGASRCSAGALVPPGLVDRLHVYKYFRIVLQNCSP